MNQRLMKANEAIWHQVNKFREWHTLPRPLAALNLRAFRDELREANLYDASPEDEAKESVKESPQTTTSRGSPGAAA